MDLKIQKKNAIEIPKEHFANISIWFGWKLVLMVSGYSVEAGGIWNHVPYNHVLKRPENKILRTVQPSHSSWENRKGPDKTIKLSVEGPNTTFLNSVLFSHFNYCTSRIGSSLPGEISIHIDLKGSVRVDARYLLHYVTYSYYTHHKWEPTW